MVPVTKAVADYDPASIGKPRDVPGPICVDQPLGPGFRLDGHVDWHDQGSMGPTDVGLQGKRQFYFSNGSTTRYYW